MPAVKAGNGTKSRRITRACDYCHQRSIRCVSSSASTPSRSLRCENCVQFDQPCTYNREVKKRGVRPRQRTLSSTSSVTVPHSDLENVIGQLSDRTVQRPWQAPVIAGQAVVMDLVTIYFEIVYPIFPLFHQPTYIRKISRGDYNTDKNLFATTMAVCALVSARVRDQAVFDPAWNVAEVSEPPSETFYNAAVHASAGEEVTLSQDLNSLRTCALLALTAIQYGKIREMQAFLGRYHTLVAMDGLHDECNWPEGIGIVETEERRRIFWSMYTLEVYASIIWKGTTRVREYQVNVAYTTEMDDELFSDHSYSHQAPSPIEAGQSPGGRWSRIGSHSWLCGWNFTTDLYRIMEHVITNFRDLKSNKRSFPSSLFGDCNTASEATVRDYIMRLYSNLPQCFKECPPITFNAANDRYGFQAANITATVQLLRMLLFVSGETTIEDRCKIASEVVESFSHIPAAYLRAISSPLLHHLAGIGVILGSVFEEPLSESAYQQIRVVLLALARLLEKLNHGVHSTAGAQRLRTLVEQIDAYMSKWMAELEQGMSGDGAAASVTAQAQLESMQEGTGQRQEQILLPQGQQQGNGEAIAPASASAPRPIPLEFAFDFFEGWPLNLDSWAPADMSL